MSIFRSKITYVVSAGLVALGAATFYNNYTEDQAQDQADQANDARYDAEIQQVAKALTSRLNQMPVSDVPKILQDTVKDYPDDPETSETLVTCTKPQQSTIVRCEYGSLILSAPGK